MTQKPNFGIPSTEYTDRTTYDHLRSNFGLVHPHRPRSPLRGPCGVASRATRGTRTTSATPRPKFGIPSPEYTPRTKVGLLRPHLGLTYRHRTWIGLRPLRGPTPTATQSTRTTTTTQPTVARAPTTFVIEMGLCPVLFISEVTQAPGSAFAPTLPLM